MPPISGDKLIFGRYSREDCGLPPLGGNGFERPFSIRLAVLLMLALGLFGWLGGSAVARWREAWMTGLPERVALASPGDVSALLSLGRMYARALPDRHRLRRDLAVAALVAAERSPRRLGYFGNAAALFRGLDLQFSGTAESRFLTKIAAAGVFSEVGDYAAAFAALTRAEKLVHRIQDESAASGYRLLLINSQAYFLARAAGAAGGDPRRALELALLMITSRDQLPGGGHASGSAALLDTLAAAKFAVGDRQGALAAQTLALGLADSQTLYEYVRHFDEFRNKGNPNVQ